MPDLLFLTQSGETLPSVRFRVLPFVTAAREAGIDAAWRRYPKTALKRAAFFATMKRTACVVLQKKLVSKAELALLRARSGRLVFDFDDALWAEHPNQGACGGAENEKNLKRLLAVCGGVDSVVAGNTFLADKVKDAAVAVDVLPTPLDTDVYLPPAGPESVGKGKPVVGWMGTSCNLFFLPPLFESLAPLAESFRVSLVSDGQFPVEAPFSGSCELWDGEREVAQLQAMDIGLMPLTDDEYTRGKCGFKLLQYMACGVVPVASDVGFNREIVTHGKDGYLAQSPEDFAEYVGLLIAEPEMRREMALRARKTVVDRFGLSAAAQKLWKILKFTE